MLLLLLLLCLAASTLLHPSCGAATDVISQQLTAHGALGCPMYLPSGLITYSEKRREAGLAAWPMNAAIYTSRRALASDSSPNETNRPAASQVTAAPGIPAALISIITPQHTHTHTHAPLNDPLSGTARVNRYQKGSTNLDFTEARDSEWQWHQLGHMQVCTSLQTDNHASTSPLSFYRPDALRVAQPTASKH